jgi:hypothetical protein
MPKSKKQLSPEFVERIFTREDGSSPLAKRLTQVRLDPVLTTALDALPNKSLWLRRVIAQAAQREGLLKGDES